LARADTGIEPVAMELILPLKAEARIELESRPVVGGVLDSWAVHAQRLELAQRDEHHRLRQPAALEIAMCAHPLEIAHSVQRVDPRDGEVHYVPVGSDHDDLPLRPVPGLAHDLVSEAVSRLVVAECAVPDCGELLIVVRAPIVR
jgi:hypothetical protein